MLPKGRGKANPWETDCPLVLINYIHFGEGYPSFFCVNFAKIANFAIEYMKNETNFLSAKQVSGYLQIPLRTVHYLSQYGKIKSIKIGGKWRYNKEDIEKYLLFGTDFSKEPARIPQEKVERRTHPRINCNFRCNYSVNLTPIKEITDEGIIKNLSAGGIYLINQDKRIDLNDPVKVQFNLPTQEKTKTIEAEGRVVRKDCNGVGVKFRNMNEEIKNKIIQYVG